MNKNLNSLVETLDKNEFEAFYKHNSNKAVAEKYGVSPYELNKLLVLLNIKKKTKQEISFIIKNTFANKPQEEKDISTQKRLKTRSEWSDDYRNYLSKKNSETRLNFSQEQKQHQVDAFRNTISKKTSEELWETHQRRSEATKRVWENKTEEEKKLFSVKMSEVYHNLSDEQKLLRKQKIRESYRNSCLHKYGVDNALKVQSVRKKVQDTLKDRYGVQFACQIPWCRLSGNNSKTNQLFEHLLSGNGINFTREFVMDNYSYDFKVGNTLIELNPSATHNSTWSPFPNQEKSKSYHFEKTQKAVENGCRIISVWDWDDINKIISLLKPRDKLYARKCSLKTVDDNSSKIFLNQHHLQGYVKSSLNIGLFYNDELVSIMTFGKPRYNKKYQYELLRYCSIVSVVGGAEKLFKYFIKNYNPTSIISYCDLSKFTGDVYEKLGFVYSTASIGKHWYNIKTGKHITDNLLRQRGFDQLLGKEYGYFGKGTSNEQLMLENGFVEIYDCGQSTFIYNR